MLPKTAWPSATAAARRNTTRSFVAIMHLAVQDFVIADSRRRHGRLTATRQPALAPPSLDKGRSPSRRRLCLPEPYTPKITNSEESCYRVRGAQPPPGAAPLRRHVPASSASSPSRPALPRIPDDSAVRGRNVRWL